MTERPPTQDSASEEPANAQPSENSGGRSRRVGTRTIALLAIAIGHVIYHALRDHVFPDAY